jgi:hypothetical protein
LENTAQKQRKGGKLDDAWLGPYTIHRQLGKGIYELENEKGKILKKKVNINRLKPFKRQRPESDPDSDAQPTKKQAKKEEPALIISESDEESEEESTAMRINRLSRSDMRRITSGQWLSDVVIHAAQQLMKEDKDLLPFGSLQDPILGQRLAFDVQTGEFVQILHSGGNHWITVSTVRMDCAHIRVYDSLLGKLPDDAKKQIASLLMTEEKTITIEYANNQVSKYKYS